MADPRDDAIRKRYRELATEEPSAALDDAIRAAARRAVSSGPGSIRKPGAARWAVPVSVAAVLFLSFSVVMRLEKEAPPIGEPTPSIVTSPRAPSAQPEAPARANAPAETAKEPDLARNKLRDQPAADASPALRKEKKDAAVVESKPGFVADAIAPAKPQAPAAAALPAPAVTATTPAPAPPPPAPEFSSPPAPAATSSPRSSMPPPTGGLARPAATAPPPAPVLQERSAPLGYEEQRNLATGRRDEAAGALGATQESRAKAEGYAAKRAAEPADLNAPWPDTAEKKLERIEALRKAGRDKEADEAINRFRREHPDYRIPDATWERIRPK